jgi:hypothetical protein
VKKRYLVLALVFCCALTAGLAGCSSGDSESVATLVEPPGASETVAPKPGATLTGFIQGGQTGEAEIELVVSGDGSALESCGLAFDGWKVSYDAPGVSGSSTMNGGVTTTFAPSDVPIQGGSFSYSSEGADGFSALQGRFTSPTEANGMITLVDSRRDPLADPARPWESTQLIELGTFHWSASAP